jgi:hypothetical protein
LLIVLTLMLTSKGMAGIPRASQVILAGTLVTFDLPLEGVLLIIGVDELMDMARTHRKPRRQLPRHRGRRPVGRRVSQRTDLILLFGKLLQIVQQRCEIA